MKIAVCLKWVPATTADIRPSADGRTLALGGIETVLNPYDEYALEAALKLRELISGSTICVLSAGGEETAKCALHAFSLGVDTAIRVDAPNVDARGAARLAAAALREFLPELVLCGRQAIDDDQWEFPGALAELLGMPHVTAVASLAISTAQAGLSQPPNSTLVCKRRFNREEQTVEALLPAMVSCDRGLNEPRAPSLKGRLDAKKKQAALKTPADLGVDAEALAAAIRVERFSPPPRKAPGKKIELPPVDAARELVRLLRDEARVI